MRKSDLDRAVAQETGRPAREVSQATYLFLQKIMEALASGDVVKLPEFGTFKVGTWHGGAVECLRGADPSKGHTPGFRVHFSKSRTTFNRKREQVQQEKPRGQILSRSIRRPEHP